MKRIVYQCLQYDIHHTINNDKKSISIINTSNFKILIQDIINDYDNGLLLPLVTRSSNATKAACIYDTNINNIDDYTNEFYNQWTSYIEQFSIKHNIKGKNLYHPLRLALTGRMNGPDIGDQILLLNITEIFNSYDNNPRKLVTNMVSLDERIQILREYVKQ